MALSKPQIRACIVERSNAKNMTLGDLQDEVNNTCAWLEESGGEIIKFERAKFHVVITVRFLHPESVPEEYQQIFYLRK